MSRFQKDFADFYRRGRGDIFFFAEEWLRFNGVDNWELSDQQRALLQCVQDDLDAPLSEKKRRIAVKSGQGPGKTTVEVIIGLWRAFLDVDALVIVTAPTMVQLRDVWIAEARRIVQRAHPVLQSMIEITNSKIIICGRKTWGIWTRSASKQENFQGYHATYLTMIFDEASGIDRAIMVTAKRTLTNKESLLIAAGNPNTRECGFFDMFHKPSETTQWHKFTWSAEDAPHVDKANLKRLEVEYGRQSDIYRVGVLGEFPSMDPNAVFSSDDLWACTGVPLLDAARMRGTLSVDKAIGIDIARFGSDESVIYRRSGLAVVETKILVKTEPMSVVEAAFRMQADAGWTDDETWYIPDADGMGQGVMAMFSRAGKKFLEFHNNGKSSRKEYLNKITEAYFVLAKLSRERKLHIPNDELLIQQLSSRLYDVNNPKGKLALEKKDVMFKRLDGASPDRADALAMAFYGAVKARGMIA